MAPAALRLRLDHPPASAASSRPLSDEERRPGGDDAAASRRHHRQPLAANRRQMHHISHVDGSSSGRIASTACPHGKQGWVDATHARQGEALRQVLSTTAFVSNLPGRSSG
ncbi:hypothetical protein JRQ81_010902 [Phrynocephalus forsythii]|uniref:Uncharacterized protein n=1 Tax=Phrynocephalus forsythii TaxID=171643 RepID=A0A9Q1B5L4_9SAUR|nr:hypothetical protein JRQ81_010902 [Phrynocephalus forsythii]